MKKRNTIGVMLTDINGSYLTDFWLMMEKASKEYDCNLFVCDGRSLRYNKDTDGKHFIVYGFEDKKIIDGLVILSSSVASFIEDLEFDLFLKQFEGIPIVSVGKVIPSATSILVDNKEGMKEQIRHLINKHGYRKIAFVKGPETNLEAIERYEAYLEVLEENNIKLDSDIIFQGDFISHTGYEIMKNIIVENIQYDAIVFSNDDMALGAKRAIKDLSEIYDFDAAKKSIMCGFDDSINLNFIKSHLTTVRQPFEEICNISLKTLIDKINGKDTKEVYKVPSVLVVRQSCGCKSGKNPNEISENYFKLVSNIRMDENIQTYSLEDAFMLLEKDLDSLENLIRKVSHNLMTPIMSISGAATVLEDLVDEYKESIGDNDVTNEDHYEISNEMKKWIEKIKDFNSYISRTVSTAKSQAVQLKADITNKLPKR